MVLSKAKRQKCFSRLEGELKIVKRYKLWIKKLIEWECDGHGDTHGQDCWMVELKWAESVDFSMCLSQGKLFFASVRGD